MISIGFIYIWLTGSRPTGPETFGEPIWWNHMRPVHALIYTLFAYKAITRQRDAWEYLAMDVVLGLFVYAMHNFRLTN